MLRATSDCDSIEYNKLASIVNFAIISLVVATIPETKGFKEDFIMSNKQKALFITNVTFLRKIYFSEDTRIAMGNQCCSCAENRPDENEQKYGDGPLKRIRQTNNRLYSWTGNAGCGSTARPPSRTPDGEDRGGRPAYLFRRNLPVAELNKDGGREDGVGPSDKGLHVGGGGLLSSDDEQASSGLLGPDQLAVNERARRGQNGVNVQDRDSGKPGDRARGGDEERGKQAAGEVSAEKQHDADSAKKEKLKNQKRRAGRSGRVVGIAGRWRSGKRSQASMLKSQQAKGEDDRKSKTKLVSGNAASMAELASPAHSAMAAGERSMDLDRVRSTFGKYGCGNGNKAIGEIIKNFYSRKSVGASADDLAAPRSVREAVNLVQGIPSPRSARNYKLQSQALYIPST